MSTKPGVTSLPLASISSAPLLAILPMAAMRLPLMPTSASTGARPVPSTTVPPRMTRSNSAAIGLISVHCSVIVRRPAVFVTPAKSARSAQGCPSCRSTSVPLRPRQPRARPGLPTIGRPTFLIDTVELAFDLDEAATRVRSRLALRRNPAAADTRRAAVAGWRGGHAGPARARWRGAGRQPLPHRGRQAADPRHAGLPARWRSRRASRRRTTPNCPACTCRTAASSPSARRKVSAASPGSPIGPT